MILMTCSMAIKTTKAPPGLSTCRPCLTTMPTPQTFGRIFRYLMEISSTTKIEITVIVILPHYHRHHHHHQEENTTSTTLYHRSSSSSMSSPSSPRREHLQHDIILSVCHFFSWDPNPSKRLSLPRAIKMIIMILKTRQSKLLLKL